MLPPTTGGGGKNKYGHLINRPSGFIDGMLEQKKEPDEIVAEWSRPHPNKKPITTRRVVEQAKHLLAEHHVTVEVEKRQSDEIKEGPEVKRSGLRVKLCKNNDL